MSDFAVDAGAVRNRITAGEDLDQTVRARYIGADERDPCEHGSFSPADAPSECHHLMTLGSKASIQWELVIKRRSPLGYRCSWHRANFVRSAGFSVSTM